jgi:Domain of unknown function (DUF4159)
VRRGLAVLLLSSLAILTGGASSPATRAGPARAVAEPASADFAIPTIARVRYGGGGDWYTGPSTLPNVLSAIRERTGIPVQTRPPDVQLTDPELWNYPYLFITGHGNIHFTDDEVKALRAYLLQGGFLHADDDYGMDKSFRREMRRVFPQDTLVEIPASYPVYHSFYDFPKGLPKIEYHDGLPAQGLGIFHNGRLLVFYSYQSDLGDGWEDPETHDTPPALRQAALRMGVNLYVFAMSQVVR